MTAVLGTYDDLIATNQRRIALLEDAARRLYREWFVHLRFPGYESVPVKDGVPEGWLSQTLGDVCDAVGGGTPSTTRPEYWGGDVTWVTPTDVTRNDCLVLLDSEKKITEAGLANSSAKLVPPETILMTSRASIGFFALMDKPACTNQGFISVLPKQMNARSFLLFNLLGRVEEMIGLATGATFKELSKKTFRALPVLWPTDAILESFEVKAYPLIQQVRLIKKQNQQLAQARDLLLPKLMSGQLDVSGIALSDEVAT
jgi:type I restriction enzyme S subunit